MSGLLRIMLIGALAVLPCAFAQSVSVLSATNVANKSEIAVQVPIIMYHSIYSGKNNDYVLSSSKFIEDLNFIQRNGYETIVVQDLIDYQNGKCNLPQKPIMITLDDGHYNNYSTVLPLMKKYDMRCVLSVVGAFCEKDDSAQQHEYYSYVNWKQIKEMHDSGRVEIQNHTDNLHKLSKARKGICKTERESADDYTQMLSKDAITLQNKIKSITGEYPTAYTYPYGRWSKETPKIIKAMGFKAILSCCEGINQITRTSSLYNLRRYNRPNKYSTYDFFSKVMKIV